MQQVKASFKNYADGLWVHFSKLPQLTINPNQFHQDPAGLYLFPESFKTEGNWHRFPYRIVCRLKPELRVLDVPKLTHEDIMGLLDAFGFQDMKSDEYLVPGKAYRGFQDRFWDIIRQRFMGEPGRFNKAWRRQGYDAIFDDKGIIHAAETQLIVLNPRFVEVVEVQEQKGTGYAEVNRVLDEIASRYGNLGEIKIKRPTQSKDWGEKILRGTIEIKNGDNYADFTVDPWFVEKGEKIPESINVRLSSDSKGLRSKWSWGLSLKFRNFDSELKRLTDPKEDVAKALKEVFGGETVSELLPIVEPDEAPDFADSSDAYIGPPFGGLGWNTHPMLDDPEMWNHGAPLPAQQFMKDLIPLLSAFTETPVVDLKEDRIRVEIEGKGECEGFLHGADDIGWWFEKTPEEMDDFPFGEVAILEHVEIKPQYRREGVGTDLVKAFCKGARKGGAQAVFLNASPFGAEIGGGRLTISQIVSFYKSMGFKTWQDQGNSQVMWLDLKKKAKADFTRDDTSGFFPEGWHDDKSKDPSRLAPDPWTNTVPEAMHSATITELYCDQDGVLSDFDQMFYDHAGKKTKDVEPPELWRTIDRIPGFWTDMDWMPDGPELWEFLKSYNPTILSAPSMSPECVPGKQKWLANHIGEEVPAIFEQAKEQYAGQGKVLIDDRESNIKKWRDAGGIGILHTSAADTIRQLKELKGQAPVRASTLPVGFKDFIPERDLVDAFNYAATSVGLDIFIEDDGEDLESKGFEFEQNGIELEDPESLQDLSAFINEEQYPKGWLNDKPETKWASLLEEATGRDFEIIVQSYLDNSLAPAITINGEFGDGRGRCLFMYSLGLELPVANYSVSKNGKELITSKAALAKKTFRLYHGTNRDRLKRIETEGLDPLAPKASQGEDYIYLTDKPEIAAMFSGKGPDQMGMMREGYSAPNDAKKKNGVILEVKVDPSYLETDPDQTEVLEETSNEKKLIKKEYDEIIADMDNPTLRWEVENKAYELAKELLNEDDTEMSDEEINDFLQHDEQTWTDATEIVAMNYAKKAAKGKIQEVALYRAGKMFRYEKPIPPEDILNIEPAKPYLKGIKKYFGTEYAQGAFDLSSRRRAIAAAGETKARRAEAKATLPEDSDLMTFYNMADRQAWADEVNEESKREWNEMTEEERIERIPEIASHTGWREIKNKPYKWDQILDGWLGMRENDAMENAPTSETFFENAKIIKNPTLVRFTDYPPTGGVFPGHQPENLGLTVHGQRPGHGDLAFAFSTKELKTLTHKGWKGLADKYGKHIFKFKVPYAVEADHISDGERQTVFDVNTVTDLKEIKIPEPTKNESLRERVEEILEMSVEEYNAAVKNADANSRTPKKILEALDARYKELKASERRMKKFRKSFLKTPEGQKRLKEAQQEGINPDETPPF